MIFRAVVVVAVMLVAALTSRDSSADRQYDNDLIKVEVATLLLNDQERSVLLVLRPEASGSQPTPASPTRVLPLVIGLEEARSIMVAFHKIGAPRPLSHDLMKSIIEEYGGAVVSCVITRMEHETFYAELRLKRAGRDLTIDCRPSDAIALAMRSNAPLYVRRLVMNQHGVDPAKPEKTEKPLKT